MPYSWQDKKDPQDFAGKFTEGLKHYRNEWDRLSTLLVKSYDNEKFDQKERECMRRERNHAAAHVVGFSHHVVPE